MKWIDKERTGKMNRMEEVDEMELFVVSKNCVVLHGCVYAHLM